MPLTDPALFQCPYLHMEDVGTAAFTPGEVEGLRDYLLKGGFLWVDDYWGEAAWDDTGRPRSRACCRRIESPIEDVPLDHPLLHTHVRGRGDRRRFRRSSSGAAVAAPPSAARRAPRRTCAAISDSARHMLVLMTHNTDISDAFEREGEDRNFFYSSPARLCPRHQRRALRDDALNAPASTPAAPEP